VRLTGNYGSEILRSAGTAKYVAPPQGLLEPSVLAAASAAAQTFEATRIQHPVTFAAVQGIPSFLYGRLAAAQSELTLRTPYMDNELVALMHRAPPSSRRTNDVSLRLIAELNPSLAAIPTDMGFGGRASRSVTRVRAAYRYLLFKAEWYYNAGLPQWAAWCDAMWPLNRTAPFFLGVHKIDHYRLWFRDRLRAYVRDMLADARSRSRPYLNAAGYRKLVDAHDSGTRNCMRDLNKIMTLELIQRVLIEHPYAA